ncbi:hypothetical protein BDZ90DRAFT_279007 [Jaminaea rosea]|uniref:Uncharacterized protein n=1 Tax=Jaminaea rosea TaxID=1569628 RepID=A0A316UZR4_9BASI|nr:hypothetical protein BDZ90DRAFT_279007 [Jaminaea rosea]PWN28665.1 hypothetical protein BDZ90DRAFT_279007 [Jaminaea rosea]
MKFSAAILTGLLATATTFISAAPASAIEERATCVEANRFGKFTLAQTQVKEGRQFHVTYDQPCGDYANVKPNRFNFVIGAKNGYRKIKLISSVPKDYRHAEFAMTAPDFYVDKSFDGATTLVAEIEFDQPGPKGSEATHLYHEDLPLNVTQA